MVQLILAEKPSQGRDIARVLGASQRQEGALSNQNTIVTWCIGHLLEMSPPDAYSDQYKRWSLQTLPIIPSQWKLTVRASAKKQFNVIKRLLKQAHEVIIATDADREGEVIAREVLEICRYRGPIQRLWLSALDTKTIQKAFNNLLPDEKTRPLYSAGLARARADWLVGMNLTRYFTITGQQQGAGKRSVLSVGRVQTPTLRLVVDRDREIEAFKPQPYWDIIAKVETVRSETFMAQWLPEKSRRSIKLDGNKRCIDEANAKTIAALLNNKPAIIKQIKASNKSVPPPLGYDLSTLQTDASSKWGFSADKTLKLAQSLYETHKVCSYPRTSSPYLPESQFNDRHEILEAVRKNLTQLEEPIAQCDRTLRSRSWNQKKVDEASHHAIIPTAHTTSIQRLSDDERKLYERICRRYIAQFYPDHEYRQTVVTLECEQEQLSGSGKVILNPGWHHAYQVSAQHSTRKKSKTPETPHNQTLPTLVEGEAVHLHETELKAKKTEPPPRYTEGSLIRAMKSIGRFVEDPQLKKVLRETSGIGQEATRAGIIKTLIQRDYLKAVKKQLQSTPKGRALIDAVPEGAKSPSTTAIWEQALDDIAQNKRGLEHFLTDQQQWITELVKQPATSTPNHSNTRAPASNQPSLQAPPPLSPSHAPTLSSETRQSAIESYYEHVESYSTSFHSEAQVHSNKSAHPNHATAPVCPKCQKPMVKRQARSGKSLPFWGCSQFPKCRHTMNMATPGNKS